jgi:hypothetical protein
VLRRKAIQAEATNPIRLMTNRLNAENSHLLFSRCLWHVRSSAEAMRWRVTQR